MHLKLVKPMIYELRIHSMELATLISAARWAANGAEGELTSEALQQLKQVVNHYDAAIEVLNTQKSSNEILK